MHKLICVGACYLDTILSVPFFPEEDSKLRATSLEVRRGGNCPNSLQVLQQLLLLARTTPAHNVRPYLMACLPAADAPATGTILRSFGAEGESLVDFTNCLYREGHADAASSYIVRSEATGSRTLVNYNDLPDMTAAEFRERAGRLGGGNSSEGRDGDGSRTWWHFEGRNPSVTLECMQFLRRSVPDCTVSVEVEKPGREGLQELSAAADVVFYSKTWAQSMGYQSAEECLQAQSTLAPRASLLLATWGSGGASSLSTAAGGRRQCLSSPAVHREGDIHVVDTVGAGDTFIAGMLFGLLCHPDDWDGETRLRFAVRLATRKVQQEGFDGIGAAVMGLLAEGGKNNSPGM